MKKILLIALVAVVAIGGIALISRACSEQKAEQPEQPTFTIVGKWKLHVDDNEDIDMMNFFINEDGTCTVKRLKDEFVEDSFDYRWSYDEAEEILTITDENKEIKYKYSIVEISEDKQSCQWTDMLTKKRPMYKAEHKK